MKIRTLKIQNFKTFDSEGIFLTLKDLTALVGENNTGKSNIFEALDLFFNFSKKKISKSCFHHDNVTKEIITEVTFDKLEPHEKKIFRVHLDTSSNLLIITQHISLAKDLNIEEIEEDDYDFEESKHGTKWNATEEFEWARLEDSPPKKSDIKKWWEKDLKLGELNFKDFFKSEETPTTKEYQEKLEQLWEEHFDSIPKEKITGDDKVLGWKNKLKGNLPKFFYIPAIKSVQEDLKVLKTNPFGEIISWLTKNITDSIRKEFTERSEPIIKEAMKKIDKDEEGKSKIGFINERLNKNLGIDLGCELKLKFDTPNISEIVFNDPQLYADDGYNSDITLKGHGLQRLAIFSLLRTYNDFLKKIGSYDRNIIVAIEEPEIYLHPPAKRGTYKLLRDLSKNKDQFIYSTHDDYFVKVEYFDEIRLFRKKLTKKPKTIMYEFSVDELSDLYKRLFNLEIEPKSLRHKYGHICDESKNEGFFAKKVILVEGETEKYALPIYFEHKDFDINQEQISLITAGSADSITYLYVIFNEFHIPCYVIFDGDKPEKEIKDMGKDEKENAKNKSRKNKELFYLLGEDTEKGTEFLFPATSINNKFAVWERNFEEIFHKKLDNYEKIKSEAKKLYDSDSKPLTGRYFAEEITNKYPEKMSEYIDDLIRNIKECCWTKSCRDSVNQDDKK